MIQVLCDICGKVIVNQGATVNIILGLSEEEGEKYKKTYPDQYFLQKHVCMECRREKLIKVFENGDK